MTLSTPNGQETDATTSAKRIEEAIGGYSGKQGPGKWLARVRGKEAHLVYELDSPRLPGIAYWHDPFALWGGAQILLDANQWGHAEAPYLESLDGRHSIVTEIKVKQRRELCKVLNESFDRNPEVDLLPSEIAALNAAAEIDKALRRYAGTQGPGTWQTQLVGECARLLYVVDRGAVANSIYWYDPYAMWGGIDILRSAGLIDLAGPPFKGLLRMQYCLVSEISFERCKGDYFWLELDCDSCPGQ